MSSRDQWNSKTGFLLAAIGSAVGLGNIWRFPYTCATNGGGAFLVPYFFAILTAGIPILILEFTIGHRFRAGAPVALGRMNRHWEVLGWFQCLIAFVIAVYYVAIVVWAVCYIGYSFTLAWNPDPSRFFRRDFLDITNHPFDLGGLRLQLLLPFLFIWILTLFVLLRGVSRGIERINRIMIPLLLFLMAVIVLRSVTLPGAAQGLNYLFTPQWDKLLEPSIWIAAYGQIFFSLSIAFAIMISYASYLPPKTDLVNSAFITACSNHGFELFAGIGIFSALGFIAQSEGSSVSDVAAGGVGLAFEVFPRIISELPAFSSLVGAAFFTALFCAGITSLISILQSVISGVSDKFQLDRKKGTLIVAAPAFAASLLFITGAGYHILEIVDAFINTFGITASGLIEVFLIGWFFNLEDLREHANRWSDFRIGKWWCYMIKLVTVFVLGIMLVQSLFQYAAAPDSGSYSMLPVGVFGWGSVAFCAAAAIVLTRLRGKSGYLKFSKSHLKLASKAQGGSK